MKFYSLYTLLSSRPAATYMADTLNSYPRWYFLAASDPERQIFYTSLL